MAVTLESGETLRTDCIVDAAGAWGDAVAERCGVAPLGLAPKRRTMVQLRLGRTGLRHLPLVVGADGSFYFKGEGDRSIWLSPHDEIDCDPCDAAPEELDVALAIDRFEQVVDWPIEAVERRWAGLRTFAPDRVPHRLRSRRAAISSGAWGRAASASRPRRPRRSWARRCCWAKRRRCRKASTRRPTRPAPLRLARAALSAAAQASWSTRSFSAWPAWPLTQCHSIRCGSAAAHSACHSSAFLTGFLSAVRQPLRRQSWTHLVMPSLTYMLSVVKLDAAWPGQRLERLDRRHQLHAVVGGRVLAARQFLFLAAHAQQARPSRRGRDCPCRRRR